MKALVELLDGRIYKTDYIRVKDGWILIRVSQEDAVNYGIDYDGPVFLTIPREQVKLIFRFDIPITEYY